MKNAIILHGITGRAGNHWQSWLHDELIKRGWKVKMPQMPLADHPDRASWLGVLKDLTEKVDPTNLVIIGHSLGVVAALDYIEQLDEKKVLGLVSV